MRKKRKILCTLVIFGACLSLSATSFAAFVINGGFSGEKAVTITPNNIEVAIDDDFKTLKNAQLVNNFTVLKDNTFLNDKVEFELTFDQEYYFDIFNTDTSQTEDGGLQILVKFPSESSVYDHIVNNVKENFIYFTYGDYVLKLSNGYVSKVLLGSENIFERSCISYSNNAIDLIIPFAPERASPNKNNINKDFYLMKISDDNSLSDLDSWNFNIILDFDLSNKTYSSEQELQFISSDFLNLSISLKGLVLSDI